MATGWIKTNRNPSVSVGLTNFNKNYSAVFAVQINPKSFIQDQSAGSAIQTNLEEIYLRLICGLCEPTPYSLWRMYFSGRKLVKNFDKENHSFEIHQWSLRSKPLH